MTTSVFTQCRYRESANYEVGRAADPRPRPWRRFAAAEDFDLFAYCNAISFLTSKTKASSLLAIELSADAVDIGKTIHPLPTLGKSIGMAAEIAHGSCTDVPPQKK